MFQFSHVHVNLVQINMLQSANISRQDRLRFFQAYCEAYGGFNPAEKLALIQEVQQRTADLGRQIDIRVDEQRCQVILQRTQAASLKIDEVRFAGRHHDVAGLYITVHES